MRNPFDKKVLASYYSTTSCYSCGGNNGVDFHHINGRGGPSDAGASHRSPFNAAPICRPCHTPEYRSFKKMKPLTDESVQLALFEKVAHNLLRKGYIPNENDKAFIRRHSNLFLQIPITSGITD